MDRRSVIAAAAALFASVTSPLKNADAAGLAFGYGANENDINAQLLAYSLPPIDKVRTRNQNQPSSSDTAVYLCSMPNSNVPTNFQVPGGFKPLIQTIGGTVNTVISR